MILDHLKKYINKTDIVSFDIFDTLLIRPYINPEDVFEKLEQIYSIPGFADARKVACRNNSILCKKMKWISKKNICMQTLKCLMF